jgi:acetyl-CoA carboxylase biotin carboxyl carrier protein
MNVRQIRELAQILRQNGLSAIEVTEGEYHVKLECAAPAAAMIPLAPASVPMAQPQEAPEPAQKPQDVGVDFNDIVEVKSPLVGVYYASPAPDAEPFVKVGDKVKKGDVLCIVEAMKLMNEITSTHDGEIVDICIPNGAVVEYGQTLFKLY